MLKFNPRCKALRGWKFNLSTALRAGAFGRRLGLDEITGVERSYLGPGALIKGDRERVHTHTLSLLYVACPLCTTPGFSPARIALGAAL